MFNVFIKGFFMKKLFLVAALSSSMFVGANGMQMFERQQEEDLSTNKNEKAIKKEAGIIIAVLKLHCINVTDANLALLRPFLNEFANQWRANEFSVEALKIAFAYFDNLDNLTPSTSGCSYRGDFSEKNSSVINMLRCKIAEKMQSK